MNHGSACQSAFVWCPGHVLLHFSPQSPCRVSYFYFPISQMSKLRLRELSNCTTSKQWGQASNPAEQRETTVLPLCPPGLGEGLRCKETPGTFLLELSQALPYPRGVPGRVSRCLEPGVLDVIGRLSPGPAVGPPALASQGPHGPTQRATGCKRLPFKIQPDCANQISARRRVEEELGMTLLLPVSAALLMAGMQLRTIIDVTLARTPFNLKFPRFY